MGIFDKAKEALGEHRDQVDVGIDKAGDFVDGRTGDKYAGQVDQAQDFAKDHLGEPAEPAATEPPA